MGLIALFLAGVPVFALLSVMPPARLGAAASLAAAIGIWGSHQGLAPLTSGDAAGNGMANGFRAILYASAAGGGLAAAVYHLTRMPWPALGRMRVNVFRYMVFLLLSVPSGGGLLLLWEEVLR